MTKKCKTCGDQDGPWHRCLTRAGHGRIMASAERTFEAFKNGTAKVITVCKSCKRIVPTDEDTQRRRKLCEEVVEILQDCMRRDSAMSLLGFSDIEEINEHYTDLIERVRRELGE